MTRTHDVRRVDLKIELAVWIRAIVLSTVTAAFVLLGYGDGLPPSA